MTLGDKPKISLNEKIYRIRTEHSGRGSNSREKVVEGTLEYLISYFGYTLEIGHSYNSKIDRHPKTIKSFISNLKKSYDIKEGATYSRTSIELL